MSNLLQVISVFCDISLRKARQELGPVHVVPGTRNFEISHPRCVCELDIVGKCSQAQLYQWRCLITIIRKTTCFGTDWPSSGFSLKVPRIKHYTYNACVPAGMKRSAHRHCWEAIWKDRLKLKTKNPCRPVRQDEAAAKLGAVVGGYSPQCWYRKLPPNNDDVEISSSMQAHTRYMYSV
jgi:hypothetical protein